MSNTAIKKQTLRQKRAWRVRKKLKGTAVKPRLCVVKSNQHLQAQLIDDESGVTIAGTATYAKEFSGTEFNSCNKASARKVGEHIAELAKAKGINEVVFDRGPFKYHGVLAELANAVRAAGLQF